MKRNVFVTALLALAAAGSFAQAPAASAVQRNVNQQQRIENGLKDGSLNTREAAALEREQAKVEHIEAHALKDGQVSAQEQARLTKAQNHASRDIAAAKHNAVTGNPASASSKRMQADVQRNVNQQARIEKGLHSGELTNHEAARLEHGQSHVSRKEARAGRDGHVGAHEQRAVQRSENRQGRHIRHQKHDAQQQG